MDRISEIREIIGNRADIIWSIADISYSDFKDDYTRAVIIAQSYKRSITNEEYDEEKYHRIILEITTIIDEKINLLKQLFDQYGIKNFIPPVAQTSEIELVAPFSFKYAAVQAGLGWIGKSGLLITREYGPRVRLGAILLDYPFDCGSPIRDSLCGSCRACVGACPWGVIKGLNWNILSKRDELLDYQLCNKKRSENIESNGRKVMCGYCLLACPWGLKTP